MACSFCDRYSLICAFWQSTIAGEDSWYPGFYLYFNGKLELIFYNLFQNKPYLYNLMQIKILI
jgi:hypothetical protein